MKREESLYILHTKGKDWKGYEFTVMVYGYRWPECAVSSYEAEDHLVHPLPSVLSPFLPLHSQLTTSLLTKSPVAVSVEQPSLSLCSHTAVKLAPSSTPPPFHRRNPRLLFIVINSVLALEVTSSGRLALGRCEMQTDGKKWFFCSLPNSNYLDVCCCSR